MNRDKLIWPITLLLIATIFSVSHYASRTSDEGVINTEVASTEVVDTEEIAPDAPPSEKVEPEEVVVEQSEPNQDKSLFEKHEACTSKRDEAIKRLDETFSIAEPYFYEIFYSPKTDTCVFTYGVILFGTSPTETGAFAIEDYFTGELYLQAYYDNASADPSQHSTEVRPTFTAEVETYK